MGKKTIAKSIFLPMFAWVGFSSNCQIDEYEDSYEDEVKNCTPLGSTNCQITYITRFYCAKCKSPCYSCLSRSACTSCIPRYYLSNYRCLSCHQACYHCLDNSEYSCISCPLSKKLLKSGTCRTTCPSSEFSNPENRCQSCHQNCKTCFSGSKYSCLTCPNFAPYLKPDGTCSNNCQRDQYFIDKTCYDCHESCLTCYGGMKNQCLICRDRFVVNLEGLCVKSCEEGSYRYNASHCKPCVKGCKWCSGPGVMECTECLSGILQHDDVLFKGRKYFDLGGRENRNKVCEGYCDPGFYKEGNKCLRCHGKCRVCDGSLETDCTACVRNMSFVRDNSTCECQRGNFEFGDPPDERGGYCRPCAQENCKRCFPGKEGKCLQCKKGKFLKIGACYSDCGEGYYPGRVGIDEVCLRCHKTCGSCLRGSSESDCSKCKGGIWTKLDYSRGDFKNTGSCFDCFNEFNNTEKISRLCREQRNITLTVTKEPFDIYSSKSILMEFKDDFYFTERLKNKSLTEYFTVIFFN